MHSITAILLACFAVLTFGSPTGPIFPPADPIFPPTGPIFRPGNTDSISPADPILPPTGPIFPPTGPIFRRTSKRNERQLANKEREETVAAREDESGLYALLTRDNVALAPRKDCKWVCSGGSCDCIYVNAGASTGVSSIFLGAMAMFAVAAAAGMLA